MPRTLFPVHKRHSPGQVGRVLQVVVTAALLALTGLALAAPSGEARLKDYLKGLNTLTSEFHQYTLSADGGRMIESEGTFYLQRPGRFRWEYRAPMEQVIVADGDRVWLHDIELDQISHQSQSSALDGTPAQLLASNEPIDRYFEIFTWDPGDGRDWVELQPKKADGQVTRIRIGFIGEALDTLLMEDSFGQITRFSFLDTKRNTKLDPKLFKLDRPIGGDFLEIQ
ncbi:MAG: outer membrane lipoprotein chaperone LolA [Chromatiaceae bacterium]|nr:outer membrane lipoprotein chaperone LolA [Chromatiaceae bacterium]